MVKTRLTRAATLIAAGSLVLFAAAACGSSNDDNKKSSDGDSGKATGKVGVILPDATTSPGGRATTGRA